MKKGIYVLIIILFFVLLAAAAFVSYFVGEFGRPAVVVPARGVLEIRLAGRVDEIPPSDFFSTFILGVHPLTIYDLWSGFRMARVDDRIRAVVLRCGMLECDWAKAAQIRESILDFRRSGKKVFAYIEEAPQFDMEYYIATACDRVILHPMGWLGIVGMGGYVPFFRGTLDKLGVRAEFEHVAEFKTAYNMFTEKGFTPPHKEEMESLYGDIFDQYVKTAAKARGKSETEFRALIDRGLFQGDQAKAAGLVDDCLYFDQVLDSARAGLASAETIGLGDYVRVSPESLGLETGRKVAIVYGVGAILTGESLPEVMGADTVARWLREARKDDSVKAIVFRVDSPGGSSVGADVIWREVELAKKVKPVVVSMSDVAGSGGYWIAMGATKIVAEPQTITGSIGVLAGKFSFAGLLDKLGVTSEKLTFGENAGIFSPFKPFTEEEKKLLLDQILWTYGKFLDKAAAGRGLAKEEVNRIGRGRIWTGRQALDLRLIDQLGGLTTAVGLAKKLAGIPPDEEVSFVVLPRRRSFWEALFGGGPLGLDVKTPSKLDRALKTVRLMQQTSIWALTPLPDVPK